MQIVELIQKKHEKVGGGIHPCFRANQNSSSRDPERLPVFKDLLNRSSCGLERLPVLKALRNQWSLDSERLPVFRDLQNYSTEDDKAWNCRASVAIIQTQRLPVDPHWSQHPRPARGAVETNYV